MHIILFSVVLFQSLGQLFCGDPDPFVVDVRADRYFQTGIVIFGELVLVHMGQLIAGNIHAAKDRDGSTDTDLEAKHDLTEMRDENCLGKPM